MGKPDQGCAHESLAPTKWPSQAKDKEEEFAGRVLWCCWSLWPWLQLPPWVAVAAWSFSPPPGTGRRKSNGRNLKSAAFKSERRHLVWNEGRQPLEHVRKECSGCLSTLSSKQGVNFSSGEMCSSYKLPRLGGEVALSEWMMDICKSPACAVLDQSATE